MAVEFGHQRYQLLVPAENQHAPRDAPLLFLPPRQRRRRERSAPGRAFGHAVLVAPRHERQSIVVGECGIGIGEQRAETARACHPQQDGAWITSGKIAQPAPGQFIRRTDVYLVGSIAIAGAEQFFIHVRQAAIAGVLRQQPGNDLRRADEFGRAGIGPTRGFQQIGIEQFGNHQRQLFRGDPVGRQRGAHQRLDGAFVRRALGIELAGREHDRTGVHVVNTLEMIGPQRAAGA